MFKKLLLPCIAVLFLLSASFAQTNVAPGDGTLKAAITAASAGDILVLESGGVYTESEATAYEIDKELTIKAADGADVKPKVEMHAFASGTVERADFFLLKDGVSISLKGIEFDGLEPDTTVYRAADNLIALEENASIGTIEIDDCIYHRAFGNVVDGGTDGASVENVVITNSFVGNVNGGPEFKETALTGLLKAENSTFWNLSNRFLRAQPGGGDAEGIVNHCTVYGVAGKRIIMAKANNKKWLVTHSIFSTFIGREAGSSIRPGNNAADTLNYCILHSNVGLHGDWDVVENNSEDDPKFADPDNGDFTLLEGSPALTMASDGGAIGDPRWVSGATGINDSQTSTPVDFKLSQNYPNPFNPTTHIAYTLAAKNHTTLTVHNILGQIVATLVDKQMEKGSHEVRFNAAGLSSGVYFYHIKSGQHTSVRKMILLQ